MATKKVKQLKGDAERRVIREAVGRLYDPRTGYVIKQSKQAAKELVADITKEYRGAQRARDVAARRAYRGAKTPAKQKEIRDAFRSASRKAQRLGEKLAKAETQLRNTIAVVDEPKLPKVVEIGVSYEASKGASSNVNFNIRLSRARGGIAQGDIDAALSALASGNPNELPSGIKVSGVNWARPSKFKKGSMYEKDGRPDDAWSFSSIIATCLAEEIPLRIGDVKPDRVGL